MNKWISGSLLGAALAGTSAPALAITVYDITRVGLYDAGHTRSSDNRQVSLAQFLNDAGQVAGYAERYNGATSIGQSAWLYNDSGTQEIGLTDAEHTRSSDGLQYNNVQSLNTVGQVAGHANRYNSAIFAGQSAWLYNGSSTQQIGLTGAGYTRSYDGYQNNDVRSLNTVGQVTGHAYRYSGSILTGRSVWFYNGSATQEVGLTGGGHTRSSDGYQNNYAQSLNAAGQVTGIAARFNGSIGTGTSAWLYNGSGTQEIGLTGAGYTQSGTGYQNNLVQSLNNVGHVAGYATRYNGSTNTGTSAWFYNGSGTQEIGLTGAGYTQSGTGYQNNNAQFLNAIGQVAGLANRYSGATFTGQSAWFYNGSGTQEIGLTGAGYTQSGTGYQNNLVQSLNNVGHVAGYATRYNGSTNTGTSAWFYNGSGTQEVGLTGVGYTQSGTGYQNNSIQYLNNVGHVAGYATRYNGTDSAGQSAWLYDSLSDLTYSMDASVSILTGNAYSSINFLGDDGLALGYYTLYDTAGAALGNRAFSFTVADGWNDLGNLVDGGLNAAGWDYLATTYRANGAGQIIGQGQLAGMNGPAAAYLLTPVAVPEPETWAMLLAGLGLVGAAARRRMYV